MRDFEESKANHLVLSSEGFAMVARRAVSKWNTSLAETFSPYDVRIVVYYRRRDQWMKSNYKQQVKMGNVNDTFEHFVAHTAGFRDFHLPEALRNLATIMGPREILAVDLDEPGGDTVASFGDLIGVPLQEYQLEGRKLVALNRDFNRTRKFNKSLPDDLVLAFAFFNRFDLGDRRRKAVFRALAAAAVDRPRPRVDFMPPEIAEDLRRIDLEDRAVLKSEFGFEPTTPEPLERDENRVYRQSLGREELEAIVEEITPHIKAAQLVDFLRKCTSKSEQEMHLET